MHEFGMGELCAFIEGVHFMELSSTVLRQCAHTTYCCVMLNSFSDNLKIYMYFYRKIIKLLSIMQGRSSDSTRRDRTWNLIFRNPTRDFEIESQTLDCETKRRV